MSPADETLEKLEIIAQGVNDMRVDLATISAQNDTRIKQLEKQTADQSLRINGLETLDSCNMARNNKENLGRVESKVDTQGEKVDKVILKTAWICGIITAAGVAIKVMA